MTSEDANQALQELQQFIVFQFARLGEMAEANTARQQRTVEAVNELRTLVANSAATVDALLDQLRSRNGRG